jgi:hypothetical protein
MSDSEEIAAFIRNQFHLDEQYAHAALGLLGVENDWWTWQNLKERFPSLSRADCQHIERHGSRRILTDIVGRRAILDAVMAWRHDYLDDDAFFSCALAIDPQADEDEQVPGSGCLNEARAGTRCDCGLDGRRTLLLKGLAAGYESRPGFKDEWRLP